MRRTLLILIVPPAAVARYGCVSSTAAPIGVFWLASLASIGYGIAGDALSSLLGAVGVLLWLIAAVWAWQAVRGAESDLLHRADSTRDHQVSPQTDDSDPLSQLRSHP